VAGGLGGSDFDGSGVLRRDGLTDAAAEHNLDADGTSGLIELINGNDIDFGGPEDGFLSLLAHEL